MKYQRILRDITTFASAQGLTVLTGFLNLIILSRILSVEDMGRYSLFMMVVSLGVQLGLNWTDASIIRFGREEYLKTKSISSTFWARSIIYIIMIFLCAVTFFVFSQPIASFVGLQGNQLWLILLVFAANGLLLSLGYIYRAMDQMKKSAFVLLSQKVVLFAALIAVFLSGYDAHLGLILLIVNASFLISLIITLYGFDFRSIFPAHTEKAMFAKIARYSMPQLFGFAGIYIMNYVDLYVIRMHLGVESVGLYSVVYNGYTVICGFILLINVIMMPLMVEYRSKKQFDKISDYLDKVPYVTAAWTALALLGVLLAPLVIPLLFSSKYDAAIPSFQVLLISSIFYFVAIGYSPLINAFDFIVHNQVLNIFRAIVNLVADLMLVPVYGIIGAAYGTLISIFAGSLLTLLLVAWKKRAFTGGAA